MGVSVSSDTDSSNNDSLLGFRRAFSEDEESARLELAALFTESPIPINEKVDNLAVFADHLLIGRILLMNYIYQQILNIPGVVMEFGTRWGQNLSLFQNLRTIYEPTHYHRKVIGFDTFEGFIDVAPEDGVSDYAKPGNVRTVKGYEEFLERLLKAQEALKPLSHKRKFSIVKGDARQTVLRYLEDNPQTIIALAYFDMDLYAPTRDVLKVIKPHLVRGSVIAMDELNDPGFPGETVAFREVFGLNTVRIKRTPFLSCPSYFVYDGE